MTERAKRAADELRKRGWQIDLEHETTLSRDCIQCGFQMGHDARFCQNCGARVEVGVAENSLADIEAAIVAAIKEQ